MTSERLDSGLIEGVRVLSATPGSVVVRLAILHTKTSTVDEAFESFVRSFILVDDEIPELRVKKVRKGL